MKSGNRDYLHPKNLIDPLGLRGHIRTKPVVCAVRGITFTYGGLKINEQGSVINNNNEPISGLYACGELVGGVFFNGYPGGSGLTSGAVFGRIAGCGSVSNI